MTVHQMIERGYPLHRIQEHVRRYVFAVVLKQERSVSLNGAKSRAARRLGIHRNTVSREIWKPIPEAMRDDLEDLILERDPPMSQKEILDARRTKVEVRALPVTELKESLPNE